MKRYVVVLAGLFIAMGCGVQDARVGDPSGADQTTGGLTWEQFRDTKAFHEKDTGVWIADGDTTFADEKLLREFYDNNVMQGQLIVNRIGTADDVWDAVTRKNLTYCVSDTFGTRKAAVVQAMAAASAEWMAVADIKFIYDSSKDSNCTASTAVVFDVNPVNVNGQYIARSFFPSTARSTRNVLIDNSAFTSSGDPTLTGVLRHELGHTIGFRHEHTRPEAGTCFEDNNWRALTPYDQASVMHYPQCNGISSWALVLTTLDKQGATLLYGAPGGTGGGSGGGAGGGTGGGTGGGSAGGTGGGSAGGTGGGAGGGGGSTGGTVTDTVTGSVAKGSSKNYGPYSVAPGSQLVVAMTGTGDPDLYVRFNAAPTTSTYNCRPYLSGATETCTLTVPSTATTAYVMVRGYAAATYTVKITHTPSGSTPPPSGGTPQHSTASGSVATNQQVNFAAISVLAGTILTVNMTGTGDPDLYVRFGSAPTTTAYDCRPYVNGATESCTLTVPAGQTSAYIAVVGYAAGTYSLDLTYTSP